MDRPSTGQHTPPQTASTNAVARSDRTGHAITLTVPAAEGAPEKHPTARRARVTANLWEWNWKSIAAECAVLAKDGYTGVQVAPPQNSLKRNRTRQWKRHDPHPWWRSTSRSPTT